MIRWFMVAVVFSTAGPATAGNRPCVDASQCLPGWVCEFPIGDCLRESGNCEQTATCDPASGLVCGCDTNGEGPQTFLDSCEALAAGVIVASLGACYAGDSCGGQSCTGNNFCQLPDGVCTEQSCSTASLGLQLLETEGVCTPYPFTCDPVNEPVCGCSASGNRTNYDNRCEAALDFKSIANDGPCIPGLPLCGGIWGIACPSPTDRCVSQCGWCGTDAAGSCMPGVAVCDDVCAPVCSCTGTWYRNHCEAGLAGAGLSLGNPGCGEVRYIRFLTKTELIWTPYNGATFNVYRASLTGGGPPGPWDCVASALPSEQASLGSSPAPGEVWGFAVTGLGTGMEGPLGWGGAGCTERIVSTSCPP